MYQCGCCRAAASLVCVHPQLPEDVCRLLGIPPLQEVVSETVDVKQPLVVRGHPGCESLLSRQGASQCSARECSALVLVCIELILLMQFS